MVGIMEVMKNYVDGEWVLSVTGRVRDIICPSNQEVISQTTESNQDDTILAIAAAKKIFL
jgi:betaine-aldehyde dehydrogenase